jgi:hypothetical protein
MRRQKPLIDTGNREGWEEIRDATKIAGSKIGQGVKTAAETVRKVFRREANRKQAGRQ